MNAILRRVKDAAEDLGLSQREIRRLLSEGELDRVYVGKKNSREYRVTYESMLAYRASLPTVARKSA